MIDLLKPFLQLFYAPARAMAVVRERAPLGFAALLAFIAQVAYAVVTQWFYLSRALSLGAGFAVFGVVREAAGVLLLLACAFVPLLVLFANLFERRGNFGLVLRQEFAPLASTIYYAWATAHVVALPLLWLARRGGMEAENIEQVRQLWSNIARQQNVSPQLLAAALDQQTLSANFALTLVLPFFILWSLVAVRQVFRVSWPRAAGVLAGGGVLMIIASPLLSVFSFLLGSPFLLIMLFLFARGYIGEVTRGQRARASFKQNLEAATLNPADASAHYNLGLIHLERKELDEARARFQRAIEIDAEEVDAHYQLGRISRMQNQFADAIQHFGQVVERAPEHSQHEIWREIGATYLAAEQFDDAHDALQKFLAHRQSDPEALYLTGRALAGMGRRREAAETMRACIEAVKTAPAYKYRADKRWLNEAQQFLRANV